MTGEGRTDALDAALSRIATYRLEYGGGLADHAAMVVEALDHAGRSEAIADWLDGYEPRLDARPLPIGGPPPADPWDALGDPDQAAAWLGWADDQLADRPWRDVLDEAVVRLTPGAWSAAGHGLLRTAHAARCLRGADTPQRRRELARGITLWATSYATLPGEVDPGGTVPIDAAVASIPLVPVDQRTGWLITDRLDQIDPGPFSDAVRGAALPGDAQEAARSLGSVGARLLVGDDGSATIPFVHAVTVPAALPHLTAGMTPEQVGALIEAVWIGIAALRSAFGSAAPSTFASSSPPRWEDLLDAAIAGGEEHLIKLTVAARDLAADGGDDLLLRSAATAACERLGRR